MVKVTTSNQVEYDVFGHSAGGQILHRLALLKHEMKANRIIASNSGFYTLPDLETNLPFGIKKIVLKRKANELNAIFNWEIRIVPNVGHDHELMGNAASKLLYE